jgi:hypothetical protein
MVKLWKKLLNEDGMKTYNIETSETIEVVKAESISVSHGTIAFFKNKTIVLVLNKDQWKRVWIVE